MSVRLGNRDCRISYEVHRSFVIGLPLWVGTNGAGAHEVFLTWVKRGKSWSLAVPKAWRDADGSPWFSEDSIGGGGVRMEYMADPPYAVGGPLFLARKSLFFCDPLCFLRQSLFVLIRVHSWLRSS